MSIELRVVIEGECDHGPKFAWEPRTQCRHWVECDWGRIEHPKARPDRGEVGHLVLVAADGLYDLIINGPNWRDRPALASATLDGPRMFYHLDYDGRRWTWELFPCHWADGAKHPELYIGRWPD